MIEKECNLWIEPAEYRCIPTIGATAPDGTAMMESGIALEAANKYSGLSTDLGHLIKSRGNHVHEVRPGLLSFPIQQYAWSGPSLQIIERSARQMLAIVGDKITLLPRPGCEAGQLEWEAVKGVLAFLPDNIIAIRHV